MSAVMKPRTEQRWQKLGLVWGSDNYAQCPTPLVLEDRVRVYFSQRDPRNKSYVSYVDLDIDDPTFVRAGESRILENGKPGTGDDEGQIPSFARNILGDLTELFYSGWNSRNTVPYHNATFLARSFDGGKSFKRAFEGPILDRSTTEPYLAVTPCVVGNRMWYVSGLRWEMIDGKYEPIYVIRHAAQNRSGRWERDGLDVIPQSNSHECFSRPWVVHGEDGWRMWFSYRDAHDYRDGNGAYSIGHATSDDGWKWERQADIVFEGKEEEWDSKMQAYSAVFEAKGKTYMAYNGNTFGRHGFGLAKLTT